MGNTTNVDVSVVLFSVLPEGRLEVLLCSADYGSGGSTQRFLPITELKDTETPDECAAKCLKSFAGLEGINLLQACTERSATGGLIITYTGLVPEGTVINIPKGAMMYRVGMEDKKVRYYTGNVRVPEETVAFDTKLSVLGALRMLIAAAYDPEMADLSAYQTGLLRTALFG